MKALSFFTKRWFVFFAIFFIVWYPISFIILTAYEVTTYPLFFVVGNVFTPLWALFISYLYFRRARDDWSDRFVTAFGWMILMFIGAVILVQPVYGVSWRSLVNWNVINANWINFIAIIVGGFAAHKSIQSIQSPPSPPSIK